MCLAEYIMAYFFYKKMNEVKWIQLSEKSSQSKKVAGKWHYKMEYTL